MWRRLTSLNADTSGNEGANMGSDAEKPTVDALRQREWRARRRASVAPAVRLLRRRSFRAGAMSGIAPACSQKAYRLRKASGDAPSQAPAPPWRASMPYRPPNTRPDAPCGP